QVLNDCPLATTDIFCGCDDWVRTAPTCQTCIFNVFFNTTFAQNPGPLLEVFWAFCQCQHKCRKVAEALFSPKSCNNGADPLCVSKVLASDAAEDCACCLEEKDEWFASWFKVEIKLAKHF